MSWRTILFLAVAIHGGPVSVAYPEVYVSGVTQSAKVDLARVDAEGDVENVSDTREENEIGGSKVTAEVDFSGFLGASGQELVWSSGPGQFDAQGAFALGVDQPALEFGGGFILESEVSALVWTTTAAQYWFSVPEGTTADITLRFWNVATSEVVVIEAPANSRAVVAEGVIFSSLYTCMSVSVLEGGGGQLARSEDFSASFELTIVEKDPVSSDSVAWGSVKGLFR